MFNAEQAEDLRTAQIADALALTGLHAVQAWVAADRAGWENERAAVDAALAQENDDLMFWGNPKGNMSKEYNQLRWAADCACSQCGEPLAWGVRCGRCQLANARSMVRSGRAKPEAVDNVRKRYGLCACDEIQAPDDRCRCAQDEPAYFQGRTREFAHMQGAA